MGCSVEKARRPASKRNLVDKLRGGWKVSINHAYSTLRIDRRFNVYKLKRSDPGALRCRIKVICEHAFVTVIGAFTSCWLVMAGYRCQASLPFLARVRACNCAIKCRSVWLRPSYEGRTEARQINENWAMDFVHDQLATGRKILVSTIVDTLSRLSLAIDARFRGDGSVPYTQAMEASRINEEPVMIPRIREINGGTEGLRSVA